MTATVLSEEEPTPRHVFVEVTDTIGAAYTSGIQRHTRSMVLAWLTAESDDATPGVHLVPVIWDEAGRCHRRLTPDESERLAQHVHGEPPPPKRIPLPRKLQPPVRRLANLPAARRVRAEIGRVRRMRRGQVADPSLRIPRLPRGSVLLELEAGWQSMVDRDRVFGRARSDGARIVAVVADIMPITHPEWFSPELLSPFTNWFRAVLSHADLIVCISEATRSDVVATAAAWGIHAPETSLIRLGADVMTPPAGEVPEPVTPPYLIDVSTIEPRKDPLTLLDAWERVRQDHPELGLVYVGRRGWSMDEAANRIEHHPEFGRRLLWFRGADDAHLAQLLTNATLAVQPSRYEGFGLPVVEALSLGCPVIASTGGALPEAGGDLAEYFEPGDAAGLAALIARHLQDPAHHDSIRERLRSYRAPTWRHAAITLAGACRRVGGPPAPGSIG